MTEDKRKLKKEIENIVIKGKKYRAPEFSAHQLADELGMSASQLSREMKIIYGKSYSDIILSLRIKEAQRHILNPKKQSYTMEEIGIMVGFMNKWSFYQAFRKYTGTTPNEWKKEQNN